MFLLVGAFIAGTLTVLAPCILPLLPIIIGGSVSGDINDKKRPVVIAASLAVSLLLFTLLLKVTTLLIQVPPAVFTYISGGIIVMLGLVTLFPMLYAQVMGRLGIEHRSMDLLNKGFKNKRSLVGPIIIGAALGPVFSSCSPVYAYILATVLPANLGQALAYIVSYVLGLALVLLLIGYYGQRFTRKIRFASNPKGWFQRSLAVVFIIVGLMVMTGYDKHIQTWVSVHTPFKFDALSSKLLPADKTKRTDGRLFNVEPYAAPAFSGLTSWINSKPLTEKDLKGKVVLVDFWTYSCINCIRNNPYIEKWHNAYKDDGLVVVGVHAPEFAFEKLPKNVQKAVKDQKITYPVALDNDFATWNAFNNRSWPASYLIDANGQVRRIHEGEGSYQESEEAIRELLVESGASLDSGLVVGDAKVPVKVGQTLETYLGRQRASNYVGTPALGAADLQQFKLPQTLDSGEWALNGDWQVGAETITARGNSVLRFKVTAKNVYIVASSDTKQRVAVLVDGKPVKATAGADIKDGTATINEAKLYHLVSFPAFTKDAELELHVPDGVRLNVFTFGS